VAWGPGSSRGGAAQRPGTSRGGGVRGPGSPAFWAAGRRAVWVPGGHRVIFTGIEIGLVFIVHRFW